MTLKVVIAVNSTWNLVNFRRGLISAMVAQGHDVVAVAPVDRHASQLAASGCRYRPLPMDPHGRNPAKDLLLLWRFRQLLAQERPDVYLGYTIKPNVYGSLAAASLGIPVINNIAGLGNSFSETGLMALVVRRLYKLALARSDRVFFQNNEDKELFVRHKIVDAGIAQRVPGSGVDLRHFAYQPPIATAGPCRFVMIARLLYEKGVREFVEAARSLQSMGLAVECRLAGMTDASNPNSVTDEDLARWTEQGLITYLGALDDVRPALRDADCVVLPSYYKEGVPKILLEAAAVGRPIITTPLAGCRETIDAGISGELCAPRDAASLAQAMARIAHRTPQERHQMGWLGRQKIEALFDENLVIKAYLHRLSAMAQTLAHHQVIG